MNEKKAKKLRQLVKHFQNKGIAGKLGWTVYIDTPVISNMKFYDAAQPTEVGFQRKLNPDCGRAVYKAMKKNARNPAAIPV